MPQIRVLDMYTANRIAAGEVVERPASIVKELLENAIDALSTSVTVEIEEGGLRYIRVTDNGCGIEAGDVLTAFERHATSKIQRPEDLDSIETLGFRGEALASIAAVAQVRMTTRTSAAETGVLAEIHGGSVVRSIEYGCPEGTRVEVENVFYNAPVRRQFLKKPQQEAGMIGDYISRMILAHPELAIKYISSGKVVYHSPGDGELRTAVFCVYGTALLPMLREVHIADGGMRVYGYIGRSEAARPNRTHQTFVINGRLVKSAQLSACVQQAYDTRLMTGKFPICMLHLTLPPDTLDVNIHPGKLEVRFRDEALVTDVLRRGVLASLQGTGISAARLPRPAGTGSWDNSQNARQMPLRIPLDAAGTAGKGVKLPPVRLPQVALEDKNYRIHEDPDAPAPRVPPLQDGTAYAIGAAKAANAWDAPEAGSIDAGDASGAAREAADGMAEETCLPQEGFRIVGQVFATYWIVEKGDAMYWIDQHAAHERLLYDKLMQGERVFGAQQLLQPLELQLSQGECALLAASEAMLGGLGFAVEQTDALNVRVTSVPVVLGAPASMAFLHEMLAALSGEGEAGELQKRKIARMACKAAVKAGDALDEREVEALLAAYAESHTLTCPHGRPVMLRITKAQLEKMFGRIT